MCVDKHEILQLIDNQTALISKDKMRTIPSNFAQVQQVALLKELNNELKKLRRLFSSLTLTKEVLHDSFKLLCEQRDKKNQNTSLSYMALPEGACNLLYFNIVQVLFKPTGLNEIITILMPSIKGSLTLEYADILSPIKKDTLHKTEERVQLRLRLMPLRTLAIYPPKLELFTQCITGNQVLFMLNEIEQIPLSIHQKIHNKLQLYSEIKDKLYKHNDEWKQLAFDIELLNKNASTPNEQFTHFINELTRSGNRYTGNLYAADSVIQSCLHFRAYLDQLPIILREEVLALQTADKTDSLFSILENHLGKGQCAETAANLIKLIQDNPLNKIILKKTPYATEEQLNNLKKKYKKPITLTGYEITNQLPTVLTKSVLSKIKITSASDYIDLLLNIPPTEYLTLLTHAQITCYPPLPNELGDILDMLNQEQKSAFLNVLINQKKQFGGLQAILNFAVTINNHSILKYLLENVTQHKLISVVHNQNHRGLTLLHQSVHTNNSKMLRLFWQYLSTDQRLTAIKIKTNKGNSLLHIAAEQNKPELLNILLEDLPEQEILNQFSTKNTANLLPLHLAISNKNPQVFQTVWERMSQTNQKATAHHYDLLRYAIENHCHPEIWSIIWSFYSVPQPIDTIKTINKDSGQNLIHFALLHNNYNVLDILLQCLPQQDRLTIIQEKDRTGISLLHKATTTRSNVNIFRIIWQNLSEQQRQQFLLDQETSTPGWLWIQRNKILLTVWESLSELNKLKLIQSETNKGDSPLHVTALHNNFSSFSMILDSLPKDVLSTVLLEPNNEGITLLHRAIALADTSSILFHILWKYIPKNTRSKAIFQEDNAGIIPLFHAAQLKDSMPFLTLWASLSPQDKLKAATHCDKNKANLLQFADQQSNFDVWRIIWDFYSEQKQLASLQQKINNETHHHLLYWATKDSQININALQTLLNFAPKQDRAKKLLEKNTDGSTLLHRAILNKNWDAFRLIWDNLSEQERGFAMLEVDKENMSPLRLAVQQKNSEFFTTMWKSVSEPNKQAMALIGNAVQSQSVTIFNCIWNCLSEQQQLESLQQHYNFNMTLFHWACAHEKSTIFNTLWSNLSKETRWTFLQKTDTANFTPISSINPKKNKILRIIFEDLSMEQLLTVLKEKNKMGNTILHKIVSANSPKSMHIILKCVSTDNWLTALLEKNNDGETPLHLAVTVSSPEFCLKMWRTLKITDQFKAIQTYNQRGDTPLHKAIHQDNITVSHALLANLDDTNRLTALQMKNSKGNTALHIAAHLTTPNALILILDFLSKRVQLAMISMTNNEGNTPLHIAIKHKTPHTLSTIIRYIPQQDRITALLKPNNEGISPIHLAISMHDTDMFLILWKSILKSERLNAFIEQYSENNGNLLYIAKKYNNLPALRLLLKYLPEEKRLIALNEMQKNKTQPSLGTSRFTVFGMNQSVLPVNHKLPYLDEYNKSPEK